MGVFCVFDTEPRLDGLSTEQCDILVDLADMALKAMIDRLDRLGRRHDPAELIAYTAHELMTPLTVVQLSLSLLIGDEDVREKLDEQQLELLTSACNCSDLVARICRAVIDNMQQEPPKSDHAKKNAVIETGASSQHDSDSVAGITDIVELVNSLKLILEPILKVAPLIITLHPSVPQILRCDDLTLFRIVLNLAFSAIQRTKSGKVHIRILVENHGDFSRKDMKRLVIECEDTAEDIPYDVYQHLSDEPGRGINMELLHDYPILMALSSVNGLVRSMDGKLHFRPLAKSKSGAPSDESTVKGSIFSFSTDVEETVTERGLLHTNNGLKKSPSGLLGRKRSANASFFPMMLRRGSNSSVSLQKGLSHIEVSSGQRRNGDFRSYRSEFSSSKMRNETFSAARSSEQASRSLTNTIHGELITLQASALSERDFATPNEPLPRPRVKKALVIEDIKSVRKHLAFALRKKGFDVEEAQNGLDGFKAMKETLFDMVLCDFLMPVMDGLDCVKQYRQWEQINRPYHRQPIIGISAHVSVAESEKGIAAGMDDFRPKPISIDTLIELQSTAAVVASSQVLDALQGENPISVDISSVTGSENNKKDAACRSAKRYPPSEAGAVEEAVKRIRLQSESQHSELPTSAHPVCLLFVNELHYEPNNLSKELEDHGWKVSISHDGNAALQLLQMRNWDAVLISDKLPDLAATQCIAQFREWEELNRVNEQRRVFLISNCEMPSPSDSASLILAPTGFNGVVRNSNLWSDLEYSLKQKTNKVKIVSRNRNAMS